MKENNDQEMQEIEGKQKEDSETVDIVHDINRKIIISSEIDEALAEAVISRIVTINDFDDLSEIEPQPIEIFINSGGGSAYDGFAIIGAMELSRTPIVTHGLGVVGSMALGIFVSGDVRISSRHTRYMYHSLSYGMGGALQEHEDRIEESKLMQRMYDSLFLERTGLTKERMEEIREGKKNYFFSPVEALNLNVADRIIHANKENGNFSIKTKDDYQKGIK